MHIPISRKTPRMGRPPLNVKATLVRLTRTTIAKIDALAGPNKRSQFIRDAIERELKRLESEKKPPTKRPR